MSRQSDTKDISQKLVQVSKLYYRPMFLCNMVCTRSRSIIYLGRSGYFIQIALFILFDNIAKIMGLLHFGRGSRGVAGYGGRWGFRTTLFVPSSKKLHMSKI